MLGRKRVFLLLLFSTRSLNIRSSRFHSPQEEAFEKSQKYKEGKFILERAKMTDSDDEMLHGVRGGLLTDHLGSDGEDN